MFYPKKRKLI